MKKDTIFFEESRRQRMYWPRATRAGNLLFLSGVVGLGDDGRSVGPTVEEQATRCFEEIKATVESVGSSMDNILHMITFMVHIEDFGKVKQIREKYIPLEKTPAATAVEVTSLVKHFMNEGKMVKHDPPLLLEIDCTALIPDE